MHAPKPESEPTPNTESLGPVVLPFPSAAARRAPAAAPSGMIVELDSLRGIGAFLVVLYHIPRWNAVMDAGWLRHSYLMVDMFFVLSGFVIHRAYAERLKSGSDLAKFQFLRFGRLYPVHILFLAVFVAIEGAKAVARSHFHLAPANAWPGRESGVRAVVEHLLLVQAIGPTGSDLSFNAPSWSISVEFYTYLIFAALALWFRRGKVVVFALLSATAVAALFNLPAGNGWINLVRCLAGFFLGCVTAAATRRFPLPAFKAASLLFAAAMGVVIQCAGFSLWWLLIYPLSAGLIATLAAEPEGVLNRLLKWGPLEWLGARSYSLYMAHLSVMWAANQFVRVVLKRPEGLVDGESVPQLPPGATLLAAAVLVALTLAVSALVYARVEKPWREKSRAFAAAKFGRG